MRLRVPGKPKVPEAAFEQNIQSIHRVEPKNHLGICSNCLGADRLMNAGTAQGRITGCESNKLAFSGLALRVPRGCPFAYVASLAIDEVHGSWMGLK